MSHAISTQIQLARRPEGWPTHDDFRTVEVELSDPAPGEVRVANEFVSVDPYMRGRMNDVRSYVAPYALDEVIAGGAIGRVVASAADDLPVGTVVLHQHGWSDVVQADASTFRAVPEVPGMPLSLRLHILGMTGLTAYVGLTAIAGLAPGDTVFVSGAAGAVGTAVGQIAKLLGAGRVIGSAGSPEKVALLTEKYGYDAAFNYKDGPVREQLAALAPEGVDVFFDNVGGDHLEAALDVMNDGGRIALCGAITSYNTTEPVPGPDNMANIITRGLRLQGFTLANYLHLSPEFSEKMTRWFAEGRIAYDETIVDGIENTVDAFLDMMRGANTGKMLVRVAPSA
ncbi:MULTISPECIES: NADP-dependent oxidoreductase [unclassified Microbacterium]|uniref:NADP-dependent oxidoreductase n=1 Tax=unclassified Microbacterium TaxID=2609290 RepID=UPI0021A2D276|nr:MULTISPECIES: NADP-dependent oxidoreductase [unclassified Microbacterium]MCT1364679.1 NADP-dependent oxidoreductase [Microbacterium sp. p3-SID131]MCT1376818.1 NADP-dependent oxidoreductase [Microbacterium sp. p3-SID337]MDH5133246.1 NADP-dependent oxidoreductase [Microbacterium sp. RD10]MDH5136677.1 NADP-dependent oxidoreductase [Microbacterium sp. RD11]MDH5145744.1 NADP-dependent oxidoreductase [Microbacterium sp. RD12]